MKHVVGNCNASTIAIFGGSQASLLWWKHSLLLIIIIFTRCLFVFATFKELWLFHLRWILCIDFPFYSSCFNRDFFIKTKKCKIIGVVSLWRSWDHIYGHRFSKGPGIINLRYILIDLNKNNPFYLIEAGWCIYASVNLPSLVHIMACRLVGAKPLSEPMLEYC